MLWRYTAASSAGLLIAVIAIISHRARPSPATSTATPRAAVEIACNREKICARAAELSDDVWTEYRAPGQSLIAVETPDALAELAAAGATWTVVSPDIDADAAAEAARIASHAAATDGGDNDWFGEYRSYGAISEHLFELGQRAPARATFETIGASLEGRPIRAIHIGHTRGVADATPMLVTGTLHAREWIAAMTTTCIADRLVRDYDTDPAIRQFVDHTDLWLVPVANPDGYDYAWDGHRYWRKNRRGGYGVDLNRNFGVAWGNQGSSSNKKSETYRGEGAFSEPETAAIRDLAKRIGFPIAVDFHSFGQLLLYPWSYTSTPAEDRDRLAAVGDRMASALYAVHGTRYTLEPGAELYPAAGTLMDWLYGDLRTQAYTIELRPKARGGFVLPPEQIRPTCDESLAALLALRAAH